MDEAVILKRCGKFLSCINAVSLTGHGKSVNQDAFVCGVDNQTGIAFITVADGLGSCCNSKEGAKLATRIVADWIQYDLPKYPKLSIEVANILNVRIIQNWKHSLHELNLNDYDTTIHYAIYRDGKVIVGGIGDGLILSSIDGFMDEVKDNTKAFGNTTDSLCMAQAKDFFHSECYDINENVKIANIIILTDGISEDLKDDSKGELLVYLGSKAIKNVQSLQKELVEWLANWETIGHNDDKTICLLTLTKGAEIID